MVIMAEVPLVHVPPAVASVYVVNAPTHMVGDPPIGAGKGFTVTALCFEQPPAVRV